MPIKLPPFLLQSFNLNLGNFTLPVQYWQALAIVGLIFLLILLFALFRRHSAEWSLKGGLSGVFFGFFLALILEGFLLIGGKTILTDVLGWKDAPAPISTALDAGRSQLVQVLGIHDQIPSSYAHANITVQSALETIQSLKPADFRTAKSIICSQ